MFTDLDVFIATRVHWTFIKEDRNLSQLIVAAIRKKEKILRNKNIILIRPGGIVGTLSTDIQEIAFNIFLHRQNSIIH